MMAMKFIINVLQATHFRVYRIGHFSDFLSAIDNIKMEISLGHWENQRLNLHYITRKYNVDSDSLAKQGAQLSFLSGIWL